jgi:hypothetical protein
VLNSGYAYDVFLAITAQWRYVHRMDEHRFIFFAYAIAVALIGGLCFATWARARKIRTFLLAQPTHES